MQTNQSASPSNKKIVGLLLIAIVSLIVIVGYRYSTQNQSNQTDKTVPTPPSPEPTPNPEPQPTPTPPAATVNAILNATQISNGYYLLVNGTVTNNSSNTAYDVGLHITAGGYPIARYETLIDMTVPITSAQYFQNSQVSEKKSPLSTLTPYQTIPVEIKVFPIYQSRTPTLYGISVTLVWSNTS